MDKNLPINQISGGHETQPNTLCLLKDKKMQFWGSDSGSCWSKKLQFFFILHGEKIHKNLDFGLWENSTLSCQNGLFSLFKITVYPLNWYCTAVHIFLNFQLTVLLRWMISISVTLPKNVLGTQNLPTYARINLEIGIYSIYSTLFQKRISEADFIKSRY